MRIKARVKVPKLGMAVNTTYKRFTVVALSVAVLIGLAFIAHSYASAGVRSAATSAVPVSAAPTASAGKPAAAASANAAPSSATDSASSSATTPHKAPKVAAPKQLVLRDEKGYWLATFTYGARTVVMAGPSRTFAEPSTTTATVTTSTWVRVYPTAFSGEVDQAWLGAMRDQNTKQSTPDILQTAMQYIAGAPPIKDASGLVIAGDASYGPLLANGKRQEGSDYNDYLGVAHTYGPLVDKPEAGQKGSLDCSGFQRMVWGYRNGLPLGIDPTPNNAAIPRRSFQILDSAPGIVLAPNTGQQITDFNVLQPGDLVFHDASSNDGTQIDHLGIYLGIDSGGHRRFISSRKTADGPTMGDVGGRSILDGSGLYAKTFRAIRRL
jgi:hypothetical protein